MPAAIYIPLALISSSGARFHAAFLALTLMSGLIILLVGALVLYFCVRYRAGSGADRSGGIAHPGRVEAVVIGAIGIAFMSLFGWSSVLYFRTLTAPSDARSIYVVGKQWMWKIEHATGEREINELHIPTGEPIKLVLTSQDAIHSFYIPQFRIKQDALPDRYTSLSFTANQPGEYPFYCTEYCGVDHSSMRGRVVAMAPADFQRWLAPGSRQPVPGTPGTPQGGLSVASSGPFYQLGCNACHVPGSFVRAPRLDGIWQRPVRLMNGQTVVADENYIRESILNPSDKIAAGYDSPSLMPSYQGVVTEAQLGQLVEFIKSLRDGWPEQGLEPRSEAPSPDAHPAKEAR